LFGCGNRALLNGGGLAVIGSRNVNDMDLAYSRDLGAMAAGEGYSIVSGGARGVDEASMLGALEAEGTVIGVLADSLLRACSSAKYRKHLMANNLVLISTFYPEAGFNAGNAMQRNKYIYCLSDAAIAVQSGMKGGTWSGAMENLKKQWSPLWVKQTTDKLAGNSAIVKAGAVWVSENIEEVDFTMLFSARTSDAGFGEDLFSQAAGNIKKAVVEYSPEPQLESEQNPKTDDDEAGTRRVATIDQASQLERGAKNDVAISLPTENIEFYDLFLIKAQAMCSDSPKTTDELVDALELNKTQLNAWLKRAVADKKLKKLSKPVRYQWLSNQQGALLL
jgi:predicted Rossmann fold nucleotide-binding protein DprA/Smf involved in DNA uptake